MIIMLENPLGNSKFLHYFIWFITHFHLKGLPFFLSDCSFSLSIDLISPLVFLCATALATHTWPIPVGWRHGVSHSFNSEVMVSALTFQFKP